MILRATKAVTLLRAFKGQTLAKRVRLLGESTRSYGKPSDEVLFSPKVDVQAWPLSNTTVQEGCSEAMTEKAISDKPSTGNVRGVPQRNNEVEYERGERGSLRRGCDTLT